MFKNLSREKLKISENSFLWFCFVLPLKFKFLFFFRLENVLPGKRQLMKIEVGTIDKFQNYEADIVLASCVRNKNLVSYVGMQRLYSTVTRAKHCLIIFGRFARIGKYKVN